MVCYEHLEGDEKLEILNEIKMVLHILNLWNNMTTQEELYRGIIYCFVDKERERQILYKHLFAWVQVTVSLINAGIGHTIASQLRDTDSVVLIVMLIRCTLNLLMPNASL